MQCGSNAADRGNVREIIFVWRLLQVLNLPRDRCAIEGKAFFWYTKKSHDAPGSSYTERVSHEGLYESSVAFVRCWEDLGRQGANREKVGLIECTGIEEAFRVFESYEHGGYWSLVSLGQMLGEIL